jgi:hypothetical protein
MRHGYIDDGLCGVGLSFIVFAQAPPPSQPAKGPLHNPALALNVEAFGAWHGFNNVQAYSESLPDPLHQLTSISAVGPDQLDRAVGLQNGSQETLSGIAILDVGGRHHDHQHQSQRVHDQVTLGAIDLLTGIIASSFIALGAFDRLAVQDGRTGFGFAPLGVTEPFTEVFVQCEPEPDENPIAIIAVERRPRRQILGHVAPLATGADDVKDAIKNLAIRVNSRPPRLGKRFEQVIDDLPLPIG